MSELDKNNTKLKMACYDGDLEKVISIMSNPSHIIEINCNHNYPLRAACLQGHLEIVKFLLSS